MKVSFQLSCLTVINLSMTGVFTMIRNPIESKHQIAAHSSGFPVRKDAKRGPMTNP